jgi:hypothetical protein
VTRLLPAVVAAAMSLAGCLSPASSTTASANPTPDVTSPVEGVIVAVDASSLSDVRGFTLRPTNVPFSFAFKLGTLENGADFPPSHLAEHQVTSEPVRVHFRLENGERVVFRLEDAPQG